MTGVEPIHTVSAVQAVAARLRDRVLDGDYAPWAHVTEGQVAADYRVSRPTAKSAITVLVLEGLLRQEANKPAYVPRLTAADVENLFFVRRPLEVEVVRYLTGEGAPSVPPEADAAVRAVREMADSEGNATAPRQFVRSDLLFHRVLVDAVPNPRLHRVFQSIVGEMHLTMLYSHTVLGPRRVADDHQRILDAIRTGDQHQAVQSMVSHLGSACEEISKAISHESSLHNTTS
jgi:DNA-binding GntR family transcriptional regulator